MPSFDGVSFGERGAGPTGPYPMWTKVGVIAIKKIPTSDKVVIQKIAIARPRLAFVARVTGAQLAALKAKRGVTGSFSFSLETTTATLESVENVQEIGAWHDIYFCTLNFIRSSSDFSAPANRRLTEAGSERMTEDGRTRIVE